MMYMTLDQALDLWCDFEDALHGRSGFGGHVAEIYAYRCGPTHPSANVNDPPLSYGWGTAREDGEKAAAGLTLLAMVFESKRSAIVEVETAEGFQRISVGSPVKPFSHRVNVRVRLK
jgi:hypothetical protein